MVTCATTALLSEAGLRSRRILRMRSWTYGQLLLAPASIAQPRGEPIFPRTGSIPPPCHCSPDSASTTVGTTSSIYCYSSIFNLYTSGWTEQPYRRERSNRSTSVRLEDFEEASEPKKSPSIDSIWLALACSFLSMNCEIS